VIQRSEACRQQCLDRNHREVRELRDRNALCERRANMKSRTTTTTTTMSFVAVMSVLGCGGAQQEEQETPPAIGSSSSPPTQAAPTPPSTPPADEPVGQPTASCRPSDEVLAALPKGQYVNYPGSVGMAGVDSVVAGEDVSVFYDAVEKKNVISRRLSLSFSGKPQESVDPKKGVCWSSGNVSWSVVEVRSLTNEIPLEIGPGEYNNAIHIGWTGMTCCPKEGFGGGSTALIPTATVIIKSRTATTIEGEIKTRDENGELKTIMTFRAPFEW
jgi:hypothetical protein